jgi:isopenicillin-N N-acyltransferase-like protein
MASDRAQDRSGVAVGAAALPVEVLEGTPHARGLQHGSRYKAFIRDAVHRQTAGKMLDRGSAEARLGSVWSLVRERAPELAAEIQGIADGSSCHLSEILLHIAFELRDSPAGGCSAIGIAGEDGAIVGQNWDRPVGETDPLILFLHIGTTGLETAVVASPGGLGWLGCNRMGLALVNNDLLLKSSADGLPSQVIRRMVLAQGTMPGALDIIQQSAHMAGRSYILGDRAGRIAGIEVSAHGTAVFARQGPVLHTNHLIAKALPDAEDARRLDETYPSSQHRLAMLQQLATGVTTVDGICRILSNNVGHPDSILKSPSPDEPTETALSAVFDCGAGRGYFRVTGQSWADSLRIQLPTLV